MMRHFYMINRNESLVEKESQWYRYRFPYSNAVNVSYAQQLLKLRSYVHVYFSHKKRFIDLAHQLIRFTVLCCEEHYSPEIEKLYEQNETASCK